MKTTTLAKTFIYVSIFTVICWCLSASFAVMANEGPYPQALMTYLEDSVNSDLQEINEAKSWPAKDIKKIEIDINTADVELKALPSMNDINEVKIEAKLSGFIKPNYEFTVDAHDGILTVRLKAQKQTRWSFRKKSIEANNSLKLTMLLPSKFGSDTKINAGSGDVNVFDLELGDLAISSGSGDISLDNTNTGNLNIKTGSGDLKAAGKFKVGEARTGSGDIDVKKLEAEDLTLSTGSGDIQMDNISAAMIRAKTGSGDINVRVVNPTQWTINARTGSGEIINQLSSNELSEKRKSLRAGSGQNRLEVDTGSGDIVISR